jgi:hypothetical protein
MAPTYDFFKAGLFSSLVTAFAVEAYQLLQVDFEESSLIALATISRQLQTGAAGDANVSVFEKPVHSASNMVITLNVVSRTLAQCDRSHLIV